MAKYAKNSIHDSPALTLNVIRSTVDLAATLPEVESNKLLASAQRSIEQLKHDYGAMTELGEQLIIIEIRMLNLGKNKKEAEKKMKEYMRTQAQKSFEDNLDKVKAFHEVGMWEQSMQLLDQMKDDMGDNSFTGKVLTEYLEQESQERQDIRYSPKELGEMASSHYKNKRYKPAYNLLCQAAQLTPNNTNISISLLKVLAIMAEETGLIEEESQAAKKLMESLEGVSLSESNQQKLNEYDERINNALEDE